MKIVLGIILAAACLGAQPAPDPRKPGPYPVGVTTTVVVDSDRIDHLTGKPRTMLTEIWYPAGDRARKMPPNEYHDFFPGGFTPEISALLEGIYHKSAEEVEKTFWNKSVRDAPVRAGRFPLVIFSHGNGGTRYQNTFWCDYLASHGYIVVAPDHTGNARLTIIDGKVIRGVSAERAKSAEDRPKDMSRLLIEMMRWDNGADKRFEGRIDTAHTAATGMSFGSYSAIQAADADPRFIAVVAMAAAPPTHTNLTVPSQYWLGRKDKTIGDLGNGLIRGTYEKHTGPAMLMELINGGHYSFTDVGKTVKNFGDGIGEGFTPLETTYDIINSYSTAFLGLYLKGQTEYKKFLETNPWPEELAVERKGLTVAAP
jgi:dienelactone hydrolase